MLRPTRLQTPALRFRRLDGIGDVPPADSLGSLAYAERLDDEAAALMGAPLLSHGAPVDIWCSDGALVEGRCGSVQWRHNGHWLWGALELDEAHEGRSLGELSERAYRDVFATLEHTGCPHVLRFWNYLPGINIDGGGLERYRQFNSGRQQAFLDASRPAFEGAPAACAIGTRAGPLRVCFLAGRVAPVPVENPRQVSAYHYPRAYGPRAPTFSRAALVATGGGQVALLISGTASIVGHASVHIGDIEAQTRETVANLRAVIDAAHARTSARFALADAHCTVYVRHAADAPRVREVFAAAAGPQSAAVRHAVIVQGDICRSDLLVEIEAHVFAPGEVSA